MPSQKVQAPNPTVSSAKLDRKLRLSLPDQEKSPKSTETRRNTISEDSLPRTKKKSKAPYTPTIPEDEDEVENKTTFNVEVERKSGSKVSRHESNASKTSAVSTKANKSPAASVTYDNLAFEGNLKVTNDSRLSSRAPSIQSMEVYREQYCCCAKRTKCERYLLVTVTILTILVIVLVLVIIIIADNGKHGYKMLRLTV